MDSALALSIEKVPEGEGKRETAGKARKETELLLATVHKGYDNSLYKSLSCVRDRLTQG